MEGGVAAVCRTVAPLRLDESGLPLTDAAGEPVSKSQRKKLKKRLDVHAKKWAGAATAA